MVEYCERSSWTVVPATHAARRRSARSLESFDSFPDRADGPHLDRSNRRRRDLRGDLDRLVEIPRFDHVEAGEELLGLGERAVGDRDLAVAHAHRGRGGDRLQRLGGDAVAALADRLVEGDAVTVVHRLDLLLLAVDETEVFHRVSFSA